LLEQQLAAGFIAAVLLVIGAAALIRSRSIYVLVAFGLLVALPLLGLVTYAIAPRPTLDFGMLIDFAFVPALLALSAGTFAVGASINRGPLSPNRLTGLGIAYVVLWLGIVLAISAFIAVWEPAFAIANLVLNAAWICFWAIPGTRSTSGASSIEINAPRDRVFAFMGDASNWPRYDEQLVSATSRPPGALRQGSRVTEVRKYDSPVRGPRMLPTTIEVQTEVIEVEPGVSITARDGRRVVTSRTDFTDSAHGTVLSIGVRIKIPFHQAFLGAMLLFRSQRAARRARAERNLARLKELLEQP
jgi:polyketide cyclase/dehydrase/lipid transport protein